MFAELISVDGYMERQATEACTSCPLLAARRLTVCATASFSRMELMKFSFMLNTRLCSKTDGEKTHQPRDGRWQPVDPLDDARLDLVDQTARGEGEW